MLITLRGSAASASRSRRASERIRGAACQGGLLGAVTSVLLPGAPLVEAATSNPCSVLEQVFMEVVMLLLIREHIKKSSPDFKQ